MSVQRSLAAGAAVAGLVVAETVCFAGQPTGDPSGRAVVQYYDGHSWTITGGNGLWLFAAAALTVILVRRGSSAPLLIRGPILGATVIAGMVTAATSLVALWLAWAASMVADSTARSAWSVEHTLFIASYWCWFAVLVLAVADLAHRPDLAGLLTLVLGTAGVFDFAGAGWWFVIVGVAIYARSAPRHRTFDSAGGDSRHSPGEGRRVTIAGATTTSRTAVEAPMREVSN